MNPAVVIHLPSFTDIREPALSLMFENVLNFIQAFNSKYAAYNVQIASFSPLRTADSSTTPPTVHQSNASFLNLSTAVLQRGLSSSLTLGISQNDSVSTQMSAIGTLNSSCYAARLPQFTTFITDSQDAWWRPHGGLAAGFPLLVANAAASGVNTVAVAGGPNYSSSNQLQGAWGLKSVAGVTQVGIPEIYDISYAGCEFPPPMCQWNSKVPSTRNCTLPTVSQTYISTGVTNMFSTDLTDANPYHVAGVQPPADFLTVNTPAFATWPGFSIEPNTTCYANPGLLTITGAVQSGCSSFFSFTVDQFVYFLLQFGAATAAGRTSNKAAPVPIMLYEASFIPIAWMQQVGAVYVGH